MKIRATTPFPYNVQCLQAKLQDYGFYRGNLHGCFDAGTVEAIKAFQSAQGLIADGVASLVTLYALDLLEWA